MGAKKMQPQAGPRERPILFSGSMVRAILDGRKVQTRRLVRSPAKNMQAGGLKVIQHRAPGDRWYGDHVWSMRGRTGVWGDYTHAQFLAMCPYGRPGDLLWVREPWRAGRGYDGAKPSDIAPIARIHYEADGPAPEWAGRLRPPMFMPRWVSRITLRVTGVRVERAREISEADISAEGVTSEVVQALLSAAPAHESHRLINEIGGAGGFDRSEWPEILPDCGPRDLWQIAWTLINGRESWGANPWVWVVEFKVAEAAGRTR